MKILGGENPLRPIPERALGSGATSAVASPKLDFRPIETVAELDAALAEARGARMPVMLDFTAEWCVSCKEMERFTFSDEGVRAKLDDFVLLQVDVTRNTPEDKALLQRFNLFGPPGYIFFASSGKEQTDLRVIGFKPAGEFLRILDQVSA